jgi:hypothetical protein
MSSNYYKVKSDDNPFKISRKITDIIHHLEKNNLLELKIGFNDRIKNVSRQTRIRPNVKLLAMMRKLPRTLRSLLVLPNVMKFIDKCENLTPLSEWNKDHPDVHDVFKLVNTYNEFMSNQVLEIEGVRGYFTYWRDKKGDLKAIDLTKVFLRSVIQRHGNFDLRYFRIHGAFWQSMPSDFRSLIKINGKKSICYDYTAQILNIIASEHKVQIPSDPYQLDLGIPALSPEMERQVIKSAATIFVNAGSRKKAYQAMRMQLIKSVNPKKYPLKITDEFLDSVYQKLLKTYPFLQSHIMSGQGTIFFKKDAEIERRLMQIALDENKVILPIHDGFIMQEDDAEFLKAAMKDVWFQTYGTTIHLKRE